MEGIPERVRQVLVEWGEREGADYRRLAEEMKHKNPSQANKWWNGKAIPDRDSLVRIIQVTGCNGHWLLTGAGLPWTPPGEADTLLVQVRELLSLPGRADAGDVADGAAKAVAKHPETGGDGKRGGGGM